MGGEIKTISPILHDKTEHAGELRTHYFIQDLHVAQLIYAEKPHSHIDIGSRVDGFISNLATFMKVSVFDIRPLPNSQFENIEFRRVDMMSPYTNESKSESVSCLHTLEHFGLGRYGDELDPNGHKKGINAIKNFVSTGGKLYLSVPIASSNSVVFNKHRIFSPKEFNDLVVCDEFELIRFDVIDDEGNFSRDVDINFKIDHVKYGCGIFVYRKVV